MNSLNTNPLARTHSEKFHPNIVLAFQIFILILAGATAVLLHAKFKNPLHLPGHHGIEFMALATFMAMRIKFKTRGLFFAFGAGSMLFIPFLGFTDPLAQIVFMFPSIVLCLLMDAFKGIKKLQFFALPLFGGLAYMMIPLIRLFVHSTSGFPYKSVMLHPVYTISMHFVFGVAGTLLGYSIYRGLKNL